MFRKLSLALVALSLTAFTEPGRVPASEQALQEQQARITALEAEGKRLQLEAEQQVNKGSAQVLEARMLLGQAQARANTSLEAAKAALAQAINLSDAAAVAAAQSKISAAETAGRKEILDAGKFLEMRMAFLTKEKQKLSFTKIRYAELILKERRNLELMRNDVRDVRP
jgi:hypothetical protein